MRAVGQNQKLAKESVPFPDFAQDRIVPRVMEELFQFNRWCDEIRGGIYGRMGLHQLLGRLAKRIQAPR